jgi:predicted RNase H-like HicB family nuclease
VKWFLIIVEQTATGFSAYAPDLPGCVSTGATREGVEANMREALEFHIDRLREDGETVPEPRTNSTYVEIPS